MDHEPNIAREGRRVPIDPDEIGIRLAEEARQTGDADPGPRPDQMLGDIVQFAHNWSVARNAEQPLLLRHIGEGPVEGDELPTLGRSKMAVRAMGIEAERHRADLPRDTASLVGAHQPNGDIRLSTAQRNLLALRRE
jgi:hypothetical protein